MLKMYYSVLNAFVLAPLICCTTALAESRVSRSHRAIPSFVLEFAPLSHLWSQEKWFPSDVATHLDHVVPQINFTSISHSATFQNIKHLGSDVFLTSQDPVEDQPSWMHSTENRPDEIGFSSAPATIICVQKDGDTIDAFYFHFYSFDEGNTALGLEFSDHVGDWEHIMVRFVNHTPSIIYLSAHSGGFAFDYSALNTTNGRATTFIAGGTHANYANPGSHLHGPMNLLNDRTDSGPIWDVALNFRGYWFDNATRTFNLARGVNAGGKEEMHEGTGWLEFEGMWGDQQYPVPEHGQFCVMDDCHFTDGPTGPIAKNLGRVQVCEHEANCTILASV